MPAAAPLIVPEQMPYCTRAHLGLCLRHRESIQQLSHLFFVTSISIASITCQDVAEQNLSYINDLMIWPL